MVGVNDGPMGLMAKVVDVCLAVAPDGTADDADPDDEALPDGVSADGHLMPHSTLDEVEDEDHRDDQVDHLMPLVVLLQMSSMVMSTIHLEAHEDLDVPDVEEEGMRWSTVMLSIPMKMKLLVMMDGWSLLLPGGVDGPQAACALLPCEIRWGNSAFSVPGWFRWGGKSSPSHVILVSMMIVV